MNNVAERARARCPHCSTTFRVSRRLLGRSWSCTHCGESFVVKHSAVRRPARTHAASVQTWHCDACGDEDDAPTREVGYHLHIGLIFVFFHRQVKGNLCAACRKEYFWDYTLLTAVFGWWGMVSCVITPFVLLINVLTHFAASRPVPRTPVEYAAQQVRPPAAGLVVAALGDLAFILAVIVPGVMAQNSADLSMYANLFPLAVTSFVLLGAVFVTLGALGMMRLRSLILARVAASVVMLVPFPTLILAVPFGIWSLITLSRANVVAGFRASRAARQAVSV
jgi:predicted Zn finger-like uncharacterized protein